MYFSCNQVKNYHIFPGSLLGSVLVGPVSVRPTRRTTPPVPLRSSCLVAREVGKVTMLGERKLLVKSQYCILLCSHWRKSHYFWFPTDTQQ